MDYIQFQEHMDPKDLLLVAVGGALGACLRYLVIIWMPSENFPWATLSVNLIGSLALGLNEIIYFDIFIFYQQFM